MIYNINNSYMEDFTVMLQSYAHRDLPGTVVFVKVIITDKYNRITAMEMGVVMVMCISSICKYTYTCGRE